MELADATFAERRRFSGRRAAILAISLFVAVRALRCARSDRTTGTQSGTSSLFTALAAWCLYAVLWNRWLVAALLAKASTHEGSGDWLTDASVPFSLSARALGIPRVGRIRNGSVDGYFDVTRGWGNSFDCGLTFAARVAVGGLSAVGYCDGVGCRGGRVRRLRGNLVARPRPDVKCC